MHRAPQPGLASAHPAPCRSLAAGRVAGQVAVSLRVRTHPCALCRAARPCALCRGAPNAVSWRPQRHVAGAVLCAWLAVSRACLTIHSSLMLLLVTIHHSVLRYKNPSCHPFFMSRYNHQPDQPSSQSQYTICIAIQSFAYPQYTCVLQYKKLSYLPLMVTIHRSVL